MDLSFPFTHSLTHSPTHRCRKQQKRCSLHCMQGPLSREGEGIWRPGHGGNRRRSSSFHPFHGRRSLLIMRTRRAPMQRHSSPLALSPFFFLCTTAITTSHARPSVRPAGPARAALVVATSKSMGGEGTSQPGLARVSLPGVMAWGPRLPLDRIPTPSLLLLVRACERASECACPGSLQTCRRGCAGHIARRDRERTCMPP